MLIWHVFKKIFLNNQSKTKPISLSDTAIALQYPAIRDRWMEIVVENYAKALNEYPSKNFVGDDKKWVEMVEKQVEHSRYIDDIGWVEFQKDYYFSEEDWKKIKLNLKYDLLAQDRNEGARLYNSSLK